MRIKKLNRRVFRRNLRAVLPWETYKTMDFDAFCDDYYEKANASGCWGEYELKWFETKSGYTE